MKLLLVRHAKAEDHDSARWPSDSQRPLTQAGIEQFRESAKQLGKVVEPDALLTSPFVRAVQTAEILHTTAGWPQPEPVDEIANGEFSSLVDKHLHLGTRTLVIVGHEPTISAYISQLISIDHSANIRMQPGSAALLKIDSAQSGELLWLAPTLLFR